MSTVTSSGACATLPATRVQRCRRTPSNPGAHPGHDVEAGLVDSGCCQPETAPGGPPIRCLADSDGRRGRPEPAHRARRRGARPGSACTHGVHRARSCSGPLLGSRPAGCRPCPSRWWGSAGVPRPGARPGGVLQVESHVFDASPERPTSRTCGRGPARSGSAPRRPVWLKVNGAGTATSPPCSRCWPNGCRRWRPEALAVDRYRAGRCAATPGRCCARCSRREVLGRPGRRWPSVGAAQPPSRSTARSCSVTGVTEVFARTVPGLARTLLDDSPPCRPRRARRARRPDSRPTLRRSCRRCRRPGRGAGRLAVPDSLHTTTCTRATSAGPGRASGPG